MDDRITCPECLARLRKLPRNEHGFPLAQDFYRVGNPARPDMGHAMFFDSEGRVSLCAADRLAQLPA